MHRENNVPGSNAGPILETMKKRLLKKKFKPVWQHYLLKFSQNTAEDGHIKELIEDGLCIHGNPMFFDVPCKLCIHNFRSIQYNMLLRLGSFCSHGLDGTRKCELCNEEYPGYFG